MSDVAAEVIHGEVMVIEPTTDIIEAVSAQPGIVLLDRVKFDQFYEKLAAKAPTDVDVATKSGRDALRSFAAEVRSEKASIDKARLRMTEEWRGMVSQANEAGKEIKERLELLAVDVRQPLTDWEQAEQKRADEVEATISGFKSQRFVEMSETAESIRTRGTSIYQTELDADVFQDRLDEAQREKDETIAHLKSALDRAVKAEEEAAELEKLRRERAEQEAAEQVRREAEEAEARRVEEERRAEEARAAAEQAEQVRIAAAAREAEERTRREADEAAEAERLRVQREHEEALAVERERTAAVERAAQAERDRIARMEEGRIAEGNRLAAEAAERQANQENRTARKTAANDAIVAVGIPEAKAIKLVQAIVAGDIPNVRMEF